MPPPTMAMVMDDLSLDANDMVVVGGSRHHWQKARG